MAYGVDNASYNVENGTDSTLNLKENWSPKYSHLLFKEGSKGGGTREIQTGLNKLGYGLEVDGEYGPLTAAAVIQFQKDHGLEADGVVGKNTWSALIRAVNQNEGAV